MIDLPGGSMRFRKTAARLAVITVLAVSGMVAVAAPAHAEIDRNKCDTTARQTCGPYTGFCVAEATYADQAGDQRWCTVAEAFIRDNTGDKYSTQKDCEDETW
jgi:hypothetical protein